jgi:glyoxylase-like metal-dependent hydrolase (beta-lactamase superfamily II)
MTGSGTNTYIVHNTQQAWVIDPGPNEPAHVKNIFKACSGLQITKVFVTHMHPDHSPAHAPIIEKTSATLLGLAAVQDPYQDQSCQPEVIVAHDEYFALDNQLGIRALHTPGHVDNHVCYRIEPDNVVITGDHIMQGSTVVIIPPHGKMKEYIASLQLLLEPTPASLAPGHGEMITQAEQEINGLIQHRLGRENKVVVGLKQAMPCHTQALVKVVYTDVDESLHAMAELSLLAHLIKLEADGLAICVDSQWSWKNK